MSRISIQKVCCYYVHQKNNRFSPRTYYDIHSCQFLAILQYQACISQDVASLIINEKLVGYPYNVHTIVVLMCLSNWIARYYRWKGSWLNKTTDVFSLSHQLHYIFQNFVTQPTWKTLLGEYKTQLEQLFSTILKLWSFNVLVTHSHKIIFTAISKL